MSCFHILAVVNNAARSIHVQIFVWTYIFISLRGITRIGVAGSYGNSLFLFIGQLPDCFAKQLNHFIFYHQECVSVLISPHSHPHLLLPVFLYGFPGGSDCKASASNAGDPGSIPGSGRSPGEGNGNPLQHSCLENPMDGEA